MKRIFQVLLVGLMVIFAGAAMAGPWGRGMGQGYGMGPYPYDAANLTADQAAQMQNLRESFLKDLVITDFAMPAMDGDEFIMQLRKTNPHLPVILISGFDRREIKSFDSIILK